MKNILIVEDSPTMRLFIKMFLRGVKNVSVTEAVDGIDAIEKLNKNSFDLIITDINMPRLNGLELIEKIRGEMVSKIPIIILTTKGEESEIEKGLMAGANSYLTKPIIGPILTNLVSGHL
ncbi:MAG: response regulator [Nitrospirota bacterium]